MDYLSYGLKEGYRVKLHHCDNIFSAVIYDHEFNIIKEMLMDNTDTLAEDLDLFFEALITGKLENK